MKISAIGHILASYLAGLLTTATVLTHGQINTAALVALAPATLTGLVETVRAIGLPEPAELAKLAALAEQYGPVIDAVLAPPKPTPPAAAPTKSPTIDPVPNTERTGLL